MSFAATRFGRWVGLAITAWRLRVTDVLRVLSFRYQIRFGGYARRQPIVLLRRSPDTPWWQIASSAKFGTIMPLPDPDLVAKNLAGQFRFFGAHDVDLGIPVNWVGGVLEGDLNVASGSVHWSHYYTSSNLRGDIKWIWEPSRFTWAPALARAWRGGDQEALKALNERLDCWLEMNPPFSFPNWSCGQETALRAINLALTDLLLKESGIQCAPAFEDLLVRHCERIEMTIQYAIGQRNNHAISEAAGLFIAGAWLTDVQRTKDPKNRGGSRWLALGRTLLEREVQDLVLADGGFALMSTTYHRAVLDLLSLCEAIRQYLGEPSFSVCFQARVRKAADWLKSMILNEKGDAPNLGGNDGTLILDTYEGADYRDFRLSIHRQRRIFDGIDTEPLANLWGSSSSAEIPVGTSCLYEESGVVILRDDQWAAMLRLGRSRFRPVHADALHLDLWFDGEPIFCDGGSFDYGDPIATRYFTGPAGHNLIEFDDSPPMRPVSRFLYSDWIESKLLEFFPTGIRAGAAHRDYRGYCHQRRIILGSSHATIIDEISGKFSRAKLRWRLGSGEWKLSGNTLIGSRLKIAIEASVSSIPLHLVPGWSSDYYGSKRLIHVLEADLERPGEIITTVSVRQ